MQVDDKEDSLETPLESEADSADALRDSRSSREESSPSRSSLPMTEVHELSSGSNSSGGPSPLRANVEETSSRGADRMRRAEARTRALWSKANHDRPAASQPPPAAQLHP